MTEEVEILCSLVTWKLFDCRCHNIFSNVLYCFDGIDIIFCHRRHLTVGNVLQVQRFSRGSLNRWSCSGRLLADLDTYDSQRRRVSTDLFLSGIQCNVESSEVSLELYKNTNRKAFQLMLRSSSATAYEQKLQDARIYSWSPLHVLRWARCMQHKSKVLNYLCKHHRATYDYFCKFLSIEWCGAVRRTSTVSYEYHSK
jgi:hypothetical protein